MKFIRTINRWAARVVLSLLVAKWAIANIVKYINGFAEHPEITVLVTAVGTHR